MQKTPKYYKYVLNSTNDLVSLEYVLSKLHFSDKICIYGVAVILMQ